MMAATFFGNALHAKTSWLPHAGTHHQTIPTTVADTLIAIEHNSIIIATY